MRPKGLSLKGEPIDRAFYFAAGLLLLAVKVVIDWLVTAVVFGEPWRVSLYAIPATGALWSLLDGHSGLRLALLACALPFIAIGTLLTLGRLRDAGWHSGLVVLFFVPVANFALFLALVLAPSRAAAGDTARAPAGTWRTRIAGAAHAGGVSAAIVAAFGVAGVLFSTEFLGTYGLGIFVGMPFIQGFLAAKIGGADSFGASLRAASWGLLLCGAALLVFAIEGIICLLMASPLAFALSALGAYCGHLSNVADDPTRRWPILPMALIPSLFLSIGAEGVRPREPALREVVTRVRIAAPPETVWAQVVAFPEIAPPREWYFRAGIAWPVRARIEGEGLGAVRYCEFSTGAFVEPVTVWEPARRLAFDVVENPPAMRELSPWGDLRTPHLSGYVVSKRGQFLLIPDGSGGTILEGTTWYAHRFWPQAYWSVFADGLIHRIHLRVLEHIRAQCGAG
ncbi:MAG: hypothetical protein SF028_10675 [Candidatus Sumerlaeia bacterium]|nr:hypothetical protein [Candidatus Sumerlaeia bacterium]